MFYVTDRSPAAYATELLYQSKVYLLLLNDISRSRVFTSIQRPQQQRFSFSIRNVDRYLVALMTGFPLLAKKHLLCYRAMDRVFVAAVTRHS